ncbi:unnamed protein product [Schistocephalus solidus]|uniref:Ig-like domain-containing protein n=1 Tax=Schistocephalus solidus TaxID=70667 RepID=A0A183T3D6_SCHSO|nr:unnamed protein product [Schistocephalus solidus]
MRLLSFAVHLNSSHYQAGATGKVLIVEYFSNSGEIQLKWRMRPSDHQDKIAKKPYNPIIGEVFHCSWRIPKSACDVSKPQTTSTDTAVDADHYTLSYCAEQVSHHPPVSSFRFVCPEADMELTASIHTQSRFQGISVCVSMLGKGEHNEDYIFSLPSAYARAILTVPWIEIGDNVSVTCPQSGYTASINFHVKVCLF